MKIDVGQAFCAIVSGGKVSDQNLAIVKSAQAVIAADSGAYFLKRHGVVPAILVGDFDSCDETLVHYFRDRGTRIIPLERDKDKTDTEVALDIALKEGFTEAIVLGAVGGPRLDHELGNIFLLESYARRGLDVTLVCGNSVVFGLLGHDDACCTARDERTIMGNPGDWVTLLPVTQKVTGVTTSGLKFPLKNANLKRGSTLGVSNELVAQRASLSVSQGYLLVIATKRETDA